MLDEKQRGLLQDMLDSTLTARSYLDGVSEEMFLASLEKQDAVLRRLESIGEAASRLSPQTRAEFPEIPFKSIRGMRNIIVHDYGEVDVEQVWQTTCHDLPVLINALQRFL